MSFTGNLGGSVAPGEKRKRDDVEEAGEAGDMGGFDGPSDERPVEKSARLAGEEETVQEQSSSSDSEGGGVSVGEEITQEGPATVETAQDTVSAPEDTTQDPAVTQLGDNIVPASEENLQADIGVEPFPKPPPGPVHVSPTPSKVSPYPAAESSTGTAATSPALQRPPPLGAENNDVAVAFNRRGPLDVDFNPTDSKNGGLVHASITMMRLHAANLPQQEQDFRALVVGIWTAAEVQQMDGYLGQTDDASGPSQTGLERYARALRDLPPRQPEDEHKEGGLVHAALTVIRLNGANETNAARDIRQLAAQIWSDGDVFAMDAYLRRIGKGEPSAREEMRFDNARRGVLQPQEDSDSELEIEKGEDF